jgi:hypothetical protein
MLNKLRDPLASNTYDSLTQVTLLLPFTCMGNFEQKFCSSIMKTLRSKHYSLKQQIQFTMANKVLDPLASKINDFLKRTTVFLHSLERFYYAQSWCSSLLKMMTGWQHSFQMLTQFTMLNKVQDPLASNINDSLTRAAVPLPFTWMEWFSTKVMSLTQESTER